MREIIEAHSDTAGQIENCHGTEMEIILPPENALKHFTTQQPHMHWVLWGQFYHLACLVSHN